MDAGAQRGRLTVARQIAEAVAAAHRIGVVHRDLKPSNVLVAQEGERCWATVIDFGLARMIDRPAGDVTKTGEVIGTPGYMSPEQLRGSRGAGPASDVYSLGALFFELFAGRPPFEGASPLMIAMAHLTEPAPVLTAGPTEVRALVARMLSKQADARPTAREVVAALGGEASSGRGARVFVAALVAVILAALAFALLGSKPEPLEQAAPRKRDRNPLGVAPTSDVAPPPTDEHGEEDPVLGDSGPAPSAGCGVPRAPRIHVVDGAAHELLVRVPATYDAARPAPVLIALHDIAQPPDHLLNIPQLNALADRDGFVLLAPTTMTLPGGIPTPGMWLGEEEHRNVIDDLAIAAEEFCLDRDRVFLWGHGNGGGGAEFIACRLDGVVALATTSLRWWGTRELCEGKRVPTIFISALADPAAPVDGEHDCFGNDVVWTLAEHERVVRERNGCRRERDWRDTAHGTCRTASCATPLVWCRAEGGRDWQGMPGRAPLVKLCESYRGEFDHAATIWAFFAEIEAQRE